MNASADAATIPATDPADAGQAQQCPRCQKPLIDPQGLGWCKGCGYCRSLETETNNRLLATATAPSKGEILAGAAGNIPLWFWILLIGAAVLAGISLVAGQLLPAGNVLPRALWASVQIGVGVALVFAGQLIAVIRVAPEDERISFKDAIVPTRLWALVFKRLPQLCGCLWVSVWGLALIVFAIVFVGGLGHWYAYLPGANNAQATKARK
jgi:hypothetical protein